MEIFSADVTSSAPLSSLEGFVLVSAAHLSPNFLCLQLPRMIKLNKESRNVTPRDGFDTRMGRAELLACDKSGVTSTLLMCIRPSFNAQCGGGWQHRCASTTSPVPAPLRVRPWNDSLGHREKEGWPCCELAVCPIFRGYHTCESKTLNLMANGNFAVGLSSNAV